MKRREFLKKAVLASTFWRLVGTSRAIERIRSLIDVNQTHAASMLRWLRCDHSSLAWPVPHRDHKPWTRWWWPGSAVDETNITRQLEQFVHAGLGGVEITPIYGVRGYETRDIDYLSQRWLKQLEHTCLEAKRLGLGVDMATGTGWPFGGPWVTEGDARKSLVYSDGQLAGKVIPLKVKRAAPGGEGLVVDPYSPDALRHYLKRFSDAFAAFPYNLVRSQFHDSFEYFGANWTPGLPKVFEQVHGYDIQNFAEEVSGRKPLEAEILGRIKSDYRQTLAQLHLDYIKEWVYWSHEHGFITRNQAHGAPANLLDLYGVVDIPETEVFGSTPFPIPGFRREAGEVDRKQTPPNPLVFRMASSAAHVMGRPSVSSETFTWLREHWKEALSFTKPEVDQLFASGINHIFYHGTAYSPEDAPWPGWLFYASTEFNPRNPWWEHAPALSTYITRAQSILQSGRPDNDVLLYWPFFDLLDNPVGFERALTVIEPRSTIEEKGWLKDSAMGQLAMKLAEQGYSFDYISDTQLLRTQVEKGQLVTPGSRYRALVIPATRRMPVETLGHLLQLIRGRATVLFEALPKDVPGYGRLNDRRERFNSLLTSPELKGQLVNPDIPSALQSLGIRREPIAESGILFIRRAHERVHDYFFANLTAKGFDDWVVLSTGAGSAMLLDPLTGRAGLATIRPRDAGKSEVYLQLEGGESVILRAYDRSATPPMRDRWIYLEASADRVLLNGSWSIQFITGGPELPSPLQTTILKSWTEIGGDEAKRFVGTARYRLQFKLPERRADDWVLDLGDVRESARVRLNGVEAATAWSLPFRLRVGSHLKPGTNALELDITNLAANRIRDMDKRGVKWKIMKDINYVNINYEPFDASKWDLAPSGLLGPVTLTPMRLLQPK